MAQRRAGFMQVMVFWLGGQRFGVQGADVREVLRAVTIAPLPRAPAIVEGVINVRGELVPVLDIRARFRSPPRAPAVTDHLIIARAGERLVVLRVEGAPELVEVEPETIESPQRAVPSAELVAGVAMLADGLVLIHDLRTFLSQAEAESLDELAMLEEAS